jgi:hypothetical protein
MNILPLAELFDNRTREKSTALDKVKEFYRLCANESQIETNWRRTFDEFADKLGGWPVLKTNWKPTGFSVEKIFGYLVLHHSEESLFKFSVGPDDKESMENVLQVLLFC